MKLPSHAVLLSLVLLLKRSWSVRLSVQHVHMQSRATTQLRCHKLRFVPDPAYFPGRCAEVVLGDTVLGKIGVIHPSVLAAFDLNNPVSALEINIEPFV